MKNLVCLSVLAFLSLGCSESKDIKLTFNVENPGSGPLVLVHRNDIMEIPLENGRGEAVLPGTDAAYAYVYYSDAGRKRIYAEAGDEASVSFDGTAFLRTFSFEGKKAPAVEYLNEVELTALPDSCYALPFSEFLSLTGKKEKDAVKLLEARDLSGTGKFADMEKGRIRYAYGNTLLMYPVAHRFMAQAPFYAPDESYYDVIRSYAVEDPVSSDVDEYREFMVESAHVLDSSSRDIKDLYMKLVAEMQYITDNYKDRKVVGALLHHIVIPYVDNFGISGIQDMENIYKAYVTDENYLQEFTDACSAWRKNAVGDVSPDFEASDMTGKKYSLSDFRGKYAYIDIWATWCGPCQRELPHLKELERQFDGCAITFVSEKEQTNFKAIEDFLEKDIYKLPLPSELGEAPEYKPTTGHGGRKGAHGRRRNDKTPKKGCVEEKPVGKKNGNSRRGHSSRKRKQQSSQKQS